MRTTGSAPPVRGEHVVEVDPGGLHDGREWDAETVQAVADRAFGDVQLGGESANGRAFIVRPRSQLTDTPIIT